MSELDRLISPEIKNDAFYDAIKRIAARPDVTTILEIGSSSGAGSTEAFVVGMRDNPGHPHLFCMEVSQPRFEALQKRYAQDPRVVPYHVSSIPVSDFPGEAVVRTFYETTPTALNAYPVERVLGWLTQDIAYIREHAINDRGIETIKNEQGIVDFDVVLIDGSEFAGEAEMRHVYGARFILLDDINAFKNYANHQRLSADPAYRMIEVNETLRNGYSIFERKDRS